MGTLPTSGGRYFYRYRARSLIFTMTVYALSTSALSGILTLSTFLHLDIDLRYVGVFLFVFRGGRL